MDAADPELIAEFLVEAKELLDDVDAAFVTLEARPDDQDLLNDIFRRMHTIKGVSGFLGFVAVEQLSHAGESLLARVRDGELRFTADMVTALLALVDELRSLFDQIEDTGAEGSPVDRALVARLAALRDGESVSDGEPEPAAPTAPPAPEPVVATPASDVARPMLGAILIADGLVSEADLQVALEVQSREGEDRRLGEILIDLGCTTRESLAAALERQAREIESDAASVRQRDTRVTAETSIRVDLSVLDRVVGLVGELVLARNQLVQAVGDHDADDPVVVKRISQEIATITSALQEEALRTRMQRVDTAWRSLPRVLRDVCQSAGKRATLEMSGEGIELDRTLIEAIRDPLVHLVRNAVDHGLESPNDREARGKSPSGTVHLSAVQDGGHVVIEVADDGAGIDAGVIRRVALERGIVSVEELEGLTEREIVRLILRPGFSTASEVTRISGRGVGMDVVASNIASIRGTLDVRTEVGVGTTFRLTIPLTLAIVPALVVRCVEETFAIDQASVIELVRLDTQDMAERIEWIHSSPVLSLRDTLLPLVELTDVLGLPTPGDRRSVTVIVVQSGDRPFGLIVDQVTKAEEIVVKPVSRRVQESGLYAGATVMGDGSAALILDVAAISVHADVRSVSTRKADTADADAVETTRALTVEAGGIRAALPTIELERLEKIPRDRVESSGGQTVVQYRDRLLPILHLADVLGTARPAGDGPLWVVVTSERREASIGLVVDRVLDVTDVPAAVEELGHRRVGVRGAAVVDGVLADLLDVPELLASAASNASPSPSTHHHLTASAVA